MEEVSSSKWISVETKLPETDEEVLTLVKKNGYVNKIVMTGRYGHVIDENGNRTKDKYWRIYKWGGMYDVPSMNNHKVTHWMPIAKGENNE